MKIFIIKNGESLVVMTTGKQHRINEQVMCIEYDQVRRKNVLFINQFVPAYTPVVIC